jgi:hypothetical protein
VRRFVSAHSLAAEENVVERSSFSLAESAEPIWDGSEGGWSACICRPCPTRAFKRIQRNRAGAWEQRLGYTHVVLLLQFFCATVGRLPLDTTPLAVAMLGPSRGLLTIATNAKVKGQPPPVEAARPLTSVVVSTCRPPIR